MSFDAEKFATYLRRHAAKRSQAHCARSVRLALEAAGVDTSGHPTFAKTYGPVLIRSAFHALKVETPERYVFLKGDIVVMEPTKCGNQAGHIAGYDGSSWISDFVQRGFWPGPAYEKEKPAYVVYRR